MSAPVDPRLYRAYLVRVVEERLLALFSEGKLSGTTHTCIGQEMSAVVLAESLDRHRDVIVTNHRCHGHYLAWTDDVDGLLAEVMGKPSGVCGGLGGSQHLCGERFFSNGIQGGIVPVAAGLAFARKLAEEGGIVAVCIGDGTLGEGVIYETFNIAVKWGLPLLVVLENNQYAQSTAQRETLAGDICARAAAFGMPTAHADTWDQEALAATLGGMVTWVRAESHPGFVRVDTYRLAAHSKGDDDRDPEEVAGFARRDPVNRLLASAPAAADPELARIRARVQQAVDRAALEPAPSLRPLSGRPLVPAPAGGSTGGTQLEAINLALFAWMADDPSMVLLGEDVRSPYGGAFKVTRGLSDKFPDRVLNTPISEAAIVGIGNGLALGGRRPVVEIMFGDFLTLCFDQLVNHAAKFREMYAQRVTNPLVVRTPMGGGRGYGPTHSQNLEKHLVGVPGLTVLVLHGRTDVAALYAALRETDGPVVVIENKLLYRERGDAALPPGYTARPAAAPLAATIVAPGPAADITVVAFGRMSVLAERAAARLASQEEIHVELIFPLAVSPFDASPVVESVARTGKLLVIEEGAAGFDLASEVIAAATLGFRGATRLRARRLAAQPVPIPSATVLEQAVLPGEDGIVTACLELFDE